MNPNPVYVEAYVVEDYKTPHNPPAFAPASAPSEASIPSFSGAINEAGAREYLTACRWPVGLQDTLIKNLQKIPIRYFICDDSGSMCANDGHKLVGSSPSTTKLISCSRWAELSASLMFHSGLAHAAHAMSEFRLLNGSPPIVVGQNADGGQLATFQGRLEASPGGGTPLCRHIREVSALLCCCGSHIVAVECLCPRLSVLPDLHLAHPVYSIACCCPHPSALPSSHI